MPLNLPSHAHGEGYSDMNTVIPEFVERVDYEKGPYYADVGNYGSAGSAHLEFYQILPQDFVTLEGGMYGFERGVFGVSQTAGDGNLLYGGEAYHDDGPWVHPDDYRKFNGILTYSQGDDGQRLQRHGARLSRRLEFQRPNCRQLWRDEFLWRHQSDGRRQFAALQPAGRMASPDANSETKITAYGFYYYLDLFSDFTYYLTDPVHGDQFEQQDQR